MARSNRIAQRIQGKTPLCDRCGEKLTPPNTRWCSPRCGQLAWQRKHAAVKRAKAKGKSAAEIAATTEAYERPQHELGRWRTDLAAVQPNDSYVDLNDGGYFEQIKSGAMTEKAVAVATGMHQGTVSKAYRAWLKNEQDARERAERGDQTASVPELTLENLDELVAHFGTFRSTYFQTPDGDAYLFPPHQQGWLRAILIALITGEKVEILSPPRHGKTELLAHICVWLVACVNPNIRIAVIGGNEDIASNAVGMVKDQLEDNERLVADYCPVRRFKPGYKDGNPWTAKKFTVGTRTVPGIKSPTMIAIGRGGKILSRDADLIICDDIEDNDSTATEDVRDKTRRWWAITLMSRKEAKTGLVVIGSRQHPDDLYGYLLSDASWTHVVEQMHDDACEADPADISAHTSCMLWPEVRDYAFMLTLLADPIVRPHYKMVYQNLPQDAETSTFPRDLVDAHLVETIPLGYIPDGPSVRLIAGLDPAGSGYQASFLWAVDQQTGQRHAVDMDNRLGGGVQRIREIVKKWREQYGCLHWVIENNAFQSSILRDEMLLEYCSNNSITIEGHGTYGNKWDPQLGVSTLATWMMKDELWIPYGDDEAKSKFGEYRRQLINFSRDNTKRTRSDIVMASWFPEERIQQWIRNWSEVASEDFDFDQHYFFDPLSYRNIA